MVLLVNSWQMVMRESILWKKSIIVWVQAGLTALLSAP